MKAKRKCPRKAGRAEGRGSAWLRTGRKRKGPDSGWGLIELRTGEVWEVEMAHAQWHVKIISPEKRKERWGNERI